MRFLVHLSAAALLVAIGIGGTTAATAADRDARAAVMGRQKIREELSAALAKGYLTRMDQYRIVLHAKEVLTADDLRGLEQTLNRIATQQAVARAAAKATPNVAPAQQNTDHERSENVMASKYEEPEAEEIPVSGQPKANGSKPLTDSATTEEIPPGTSQPASHFTSDDPEDCECDPEEFHFVNRNWIDVELSTGIEGFKGPLDVGNANGNFGEQFGVNAAMPVLRRLGVSLQAGTSIVLSNLKGSPYPAPNATIRDQFFTTVGMFQRLNRESGAYTWGFAYDWLLDDYYSNFHFGQWRVKAAYEPDPCDEFGIQVSLPEHGSTGYLPDIFGSTQAVAFKPITQGNLYWKHAWANDITLTGRLGVAERPGLFVFGGESRVPLTRNLALTSDWTYILPNAAGGPIAQTQEVWNVSIGLEFALGSFGRGGVGRYQPFLPLANNGSFAVRETDQ